MFNFTTQTVYNKVTKHDLSSDGRRVPRSANLILGAEEDTPFVRIGNTRFDADFIEEIQVKAPSLESLASVTFDLTPVVEKANEEFAPDEITARIALYIGLSMNSQDSFYANDFVYKGKPLYIEFFAKKGEGADAIAKRAKAIADKYLLFTVPQRMLDVTIDTAAAVGADPGPAADATGSITFTGIDGYQQIRKAELQWYNPEAKTVDCCTKDGDYEVLVYGVPVIYTIDETTGLAKAGDTAQNVGEDGTPTNLAENEVPILPGIEAFCDYNWLIHNLRLPTAATYYPWSVANQAGEMPIPGQQYTQIIVRMCKQRDGIWSGAVGQRTTSVTTHVFYAAGKINENNTPAKEIYTAFNTLASAKIKTEADTVLAEPFASITE